ncbi:DUF4411 family protein [Riemerella anatipestifer]|uniref:DUF4411 domain-containing protein n=4 Tax=Riemerella anatipestifer TaxID=34085 RepID=J9QTL8_RIEAN|nr:DUF4411 family protein [Riemerella anatipestifer]ADQ81634.1 hypothetical protein Riean_0466 [Riemerella anatipestifer ATCC 11845 = DSM 15868]AFD55648.1 hypothetical protein RA0C_0688 [Riemerella anatipestifer ATCC 11845 = DSM 15868]AFR36141.1 hypothetical protein B739_1549 [Riemerella anatipestifer RA-CH-1]AGC40458.1 hypothetical protein G148_1154 [Riemerella anatipestifer RA-CH-2]AIH03142.1 hypothetical protein M949_1975 [Riemerella anatipestifer CH3]
MKVIIDTNSLLSLVRYYLPFDKENLLFNFIKEKIEIGEIIIIDKVYEQCTYNAKGLVLNQLAFLTDKTFLKKSKTPYKTGTLFAPSPAKFLRMLENQFVVTVQRKKITDVEFEVSKNKHLEDADIKQIILCLNLMKSEPDVYLVTEETAESNDNKLFKKIPAMCNELNIQCIALPKLLKIYEKDISVLFKK